MLSIVATPIGHLKDITLRALETLAAAEVILCEDTRHAGILLKHYQIDRPLLSWHAHSSAGQMAKIMGLLTAGKHIALMSDAGTPGISDPGYKIIAGAIAAGIKVEPIPGAAAFLTALQASGAPINQFAYYGYLPHKKGRQTLWQKMKAEDKTVVFYESVHRISKALAEMAIVWGEDRYIIVGRELTKIHEEFLRGSVGEIKQHFAKNLPRGEFVVIVPADYINKGDYE